MFRWTNNDALIDGRYKLVSWSGRIELYDLEADPGETRNIAAEEPERVERMLARIEQIRAENEARRRSNLAFDDDQVLESVSESTRERLRAMGYID